MVEFPKDLLMPSNVTTIGMVAGIVLAAFERFRRFGLKLALAACLCFLALSTGGVAALLLRPLEYRYPPVANAAQHSDVEWIVLLTSYAAPDPLMPLSSRVDGHTAFRVLEARRLQLESPGCRILVSGGGATPGIVRDLLVAMGVDGASIIFDAASQHTDDSATNLETLIGPRPFFLVTSAGHMARAIGVFRRRGLNPVAAPTDYLMPKNVFSASIGARIQHLHFADLAVREYAGILWYKIRGIM